MDIFLNRGGGTGEAGEATASPEFRGFTTGVEVVLKESKGQSKRLLKISKHIDVILRIDFVTAYMVVRVSPYVFYKKFFMERWRE